MPTVPPINAKQLALTPRGKAWLALFEANDRATIEEILSNLILISHTEFERSIRKEISRSSKSAGGPVALFATRECNPGQQYFVAGQEVNAVGGGSDLGSEARVAAIIRDLCRAAPEKYLNHPNIKGMREKHCRCILVVDDFIGSGERTREFLASMWLDPSIRAWKSLKWISFRAVAYSATEHGLARVQRHKCRPKVRVVRHCPTIFSLPISTVELKNWKRLLRKYAARTTQQDDPYGYDETGAIIVFEHGCPDNCPPMFWDSANSTSSWHPLFPERSVLIDEASVFPPELATPDPAKILETVGQKRLASSAALGLSGPIGNTILMIIALVAKGVRTRANLAHATGLSARECAKILDQCVEWKFLSPGLRPTSLGLKELGYARGLQVEEKRVPSKGEDWYYPRQLRGPVNG